MFHITQESLLGFFFFVSSPQDRTFYLVKNKTSRAVLSARHRGVAQPLCQEAGDGSPGWVARNLCATES